ncbi:MAG: 4-hydroxy-tetrahydrodipicolinate reductase [Candidatus Omnitrophota bacterium]|nr:4-hydroxy-tetrahydrodipicolinate reductase [Candidatus Omnitrophota bacterium]MBU1928544.1 4-hydroxy-tetrahydrodipicolinate reductase [Candidatus Omnitrophota bacterium]MBU2034904.1 4-hydroxy-tetrahydrodipicolinate reductase [Candidatus Omnitrophota bacterium]MBU2221362.1 4-hydroxy-tetrahydrodipicolinate reductase [Candidatus Omnitrophota bacterium]MBU2258827.1 4-hydroxy-tetrahydrodipicolinate reductase [Candidatus Omnitrophota bacterium]
MIKLGIAGVCGKMGSRIFSLARSNKDFEVTLALERKGIPEIGKELGKIKISSGPDGLFLVDVFIDFTVPEASMANLDYVARYKKALVLGTTGFNELEIEKIREISKVVPVLFTPNMSVGMNVLFRVLPDIAKRLGPDYAIEIVEAHHKAKKDAPSGTAKKISQVLVEATGKEMPVHSLRLGDIVGDHTVIFCGNSERIEIKHQAHSRDLFALGALKAAKWVADKPAGLYSMQDVLKQ